MGISGNTPHLRHSAADPKKKEVIRILELYRRIKTKIKKLRMKILFKIAKNEFRYLFYSPIAWFLLIVFLVQCAVFYTTNIYNSANVQDIMMKNSPNFKDSSSSLTFYFFATTGVFSSVMRNLYLFIPLLTMGLISREINSGSVKLLYSSPVKLRQIVMGKYLGIMLFNLLLIFILGVFMVTGVFNIRHVDYGLLLSATLGFYLLVCAYSAIGLFMSSLSTYQIVSAVSTFTIIFVLTRIDGLWQKYDFVRDLTYFLSLQNRTYKMLFGLIVSRDVIYFIVVAYMFIGFTLIKLRAGREAKPWYVKAGRYAFVMATALAVGYITSRPTLTGYLDATATKRNTIPKPMQQIIKEMGDSTLEVTLYTNLLGGGLGHGLPEARNADYLSNFWEPYLRFKPDMVFKYEYYYDIDTKGADSIIYKSFSGKILKQIAAENADAIDADFSLFRSPQEMHKTIDLQPEGYRVVMKLKYQGRTTYLRTYEDPFFWPDLTNISAAFKRLLQSKIPKVCFVTGELERSIYKTGEREYAAHTASKGSRGALVNIGFDVDTVNLATQDIPAGITLLVLADPKMDISPAVFSKLKNYINSGGNMFLTGEPGKQYVLNPFLQQLGVQLMNGQLVQPTFDETPDKVNAYLTTNGLSDHFLFLRKSMEAHEETLKGLMPGVTGLAYSKDSGFAITPLMATPPNSTWLKGGNLVVDSTLPEFNPQEGDLKENSFSPAIQLTRQINGKEQRIIVCGDADFADNMRMGANYFYLLPFYSWTTYDLFPIPMPRIDPKDTSLRISVAGAVLQKTVYVWVLPALVLLLGVILLVRRKRK
jgi:ABC-2 type transport system permease protein